MSIKKIFQEIRKEIKENKVNKDYETSHNAFPYHTNKSIPTKPSKIRKIINAFILFIILIFAGGIYMFIRDL